MKLKVGTSKQIMKNLTWWVWLNREHGVNLFVLLFQTYPDWREKYFPHFGETPIDELRIQPKVRKKKNS